MVQGDKGYTADMPALTEFITTALSPGIGLTSVIFYANGLHSRFSTITGRARDLNKEARQLSSDNLIRMESLRIQVNFLTRRAAIIRRAIVVVYFAMFSFILTILALLFLNFFQLQPWQPVALVTFALGFISLGVATVINGTEVALAQDTLSEDIRTSFLGPSPDSRPEH